MGQYGSSWGCFGGFEGLIGCIWQLMAMYGSFLPMWGFRRLEANWRWVVNLVNERFTSMMGMLVG